MSRLMRTLIVIGVVLDLGISGYLIAQQQQIDNNHAKSTCWNHVLDKAVTDHPTRAYLIGLAEHCKSLP